ncbi:MAG: ABC transporter ATP-binding protein [Gemmatimonadota bacterium]
MKTSLRLLGDLRPYRGRATLALLTMVISSALDGLTIVLLIPLLKTLFGTAGLLEGQATQLERVTSAVLGPLLAGTTRPEAAARIVGALLLGLVIKNAMGYASNQLNVAVQEGLVRDLRTRLFRHLLVLDLGYFQRTRGGQLISGIVTDADNTKGAANAVLTLLVQNVVIMATTLVVLFTISWRLSALVLLAAPVLLVGIQALLRRLRRHASERAQEVGELTATVAERLGAIKLIRGYGGEALESERFAAQADRYRKRVIRTQRFASLTSPVSEIFGGVMIVLVIWAATVPAIVGGALSAESTIVFLVAALKMMSPLKSLTGFPAAMAVATASAERVYAMLDRPATDVDRPDEQPARFEREVVFDHVSFAYDGEDRVLEDISFRVPRGTAVAIVGPSGAGKTTLVELLPRFHDPTEGQILLDGVPLTRLTRRSIRALMGIVSQDTLMLNDTVHANIAYGRPSATRDEVEAAARAANAYEFIAALPRGFDTRLGERGTRLSGGQRQRIAIARALLRDPPILILDEATSALDTESERLVQQAIERLMRDRTVFVIAHRLATVRDADEILVIDDGRLVERGTHETLYRAGGLYRRLHDLQFRDDPAGAPALALPES